MIWSYRLAVTLAISLVATSLTGCAALEDCQYEQSQEFRAWLAYASSHDGAGKKHRSDYRSGWIDGFYEVASGGPECPPSIAPKRYWKANLVGKKIDERRYAYYDGWQDGARRAVAMPDTHYLKIFETNQCPFPKCNCETESCESCVTQASISAQDFEANSFTINEIGSLIPNRIEAAQQPPGEAKPVSPMFLTPEESQLPTYETLLDSTFNSSP